MLRTCFVSLTAMCCVFVAGAAFAAGSDSHTVTVTVSAINELSISGGNLTLTVNTATAGSEPSDATDSTTRDLLWTTNATSKKITVATSVIFQNFTLKVTAANVTGGTAAPRVDVSERDFVGRDRA